MGARARETKVVRIPIELIEALREKDRVLREIGNDAEVVRTALRLFVKRERNSRALKAR